MSIGSQSAALKRLLLQVQGKIFKHSAFTKVAGVTIDDPSYFSNAEEIDKIANELARIAKQIDVLFANVGTHEFVAKKIPRGAKGNFRRYSAMQSVRDKRREVQSVYQLAADVLEQLTDLRKSNARPPLEDLIMNGLSEDAKDVQKAIEVAAKHKGQDGQIDFHPTGMYNVPLPFIIALIALYLKFRDR